MNKLRLNMVKLHNRDAYFASLQIVRSFLQSVAVRAKKGMHRVPTLNA